MDDVRLIVVDLLNLPLKISLGAYCCLVDDADPVPEALLPSRIHQLLLLLYH